MRKIHDFNTGDGVMGRWTCRFLIVLIVLNVVAVVLESLDSLNQTQPARAFVCCCVRASERRRCSLKLKLDES